MITAIGQIAVMVRELDRAVAFYRDVLQLPFLFQAQPGLAFFDCGGVRLLLEVQQEAGPLRSSILYYRVADIDAAAAALRERGVTFESPPHRIARLADHDLWMGFFRDTEQNLVALMSEVPIRGDT